MSSKQVFISITIGKNTFPIGQLWHHTHKGKQSASFEYAQAWLQTKNRFVLEPTLELMETKFHTDYVHTQPTLL